MSDNDYKEILVRYEFKYQFGHPLVNCIDFKDLLAELDRVREECRANQILHHEYEDDPPK